MPTTDLIQIKPREVRRRIVLFLYPSERAAKIKTLAGRRRHQQAPHWTVPRAKALGTPLLRLFAGEPSYAAACDCHASPGRWLRLHLSCLGAS